MRPATKFALTNGGAALCALGAVALLPYLGKSFRFGDLPLLLGSAIFAVLLVAGPYLASKRSWISDRITLIRCCLAAVPLFFVPFALFLPMVGWGDPEEHLVRGFLHHLHRALPTAWVAGIGTALTLSIAAVLIASFVWLSASILTSVWSGQLWLLMAGGSVILGTLLIPGACLLFLFDQNRIVAIVGASLFVFGFGVAFAFGIVLSHVPIRWSRTLVIAATPLLLWALTAGSALLKSSPEERLPEASPLQILDLSKADSVVDAGKGWTRFPLLFDQAWSWATTASPIAHDGAGHTVFPLHPLHYKSEPGPGEGRDLWFEEAGRRHFLTHYRCSEIALYQISEDRVLAIACAQWGLFDTRGNQVGFHDLVRPNVRFAAVSQDRRRFAVIIFLVGFGDPPHLEEETIAVYDTANAHPMSAVKLSPVPLVESWGALSPDGSLLAVGAQPTLRLFQSPPAGYGPPE